MAQGQTLKEIEGNLIRIKEDPHNIVYEIETDIMGLHGSLYIDKTRPPVFDRLVLTKGDPEDE